MEMENHKNAALAKKRSFEAWIDYVFNHPVTDPAWHFKDIEKDDWEPPEDAIVEYITRLFTDAETVLSPFSNAQVNQGLWYILSPSCSNHMFALLRHPVSWRKREKAIIAAYSLFERYFVKHCANIIERDKKREPLNNVCFMWWDVFPWHGHPNEPQHAELDNAVLSVMEKILLIPHDACRESALHGLGHWKMSYPDRVTKTIDAFLIHNPDLRPELKDYALRARAGRVQ